MMTIEALFVEFAARRQPNGRFIKRLHKDFLEKILSCDGLNEFVTLDEKIWALKNKVTTRPRCYCGKVTTFHTSSSKYHTYCSSSCVSTDPHTSVQRNLLRLKTDWSSKAQATIQHRYGKEGIKSRREAGVVKKYGVTNYFASDEFRNKITEINLKKYKVPHFSQTPEFKLKYKQACLAKYGVEHYAKSNEYKEKRGEIYKRQQENLRKKYSVDHSSQIKIRDVLYLINDHDWLFEQYITLNKSTQQLVDELGISATTVLNYLRRHEIGIKYNFGYSYRCIAWLTQVAEESGVYIQHACNGGEFVIPGTRYRADGYCKETNTIYEFHGDIYHGNPNIFDPDECPHPYTTETAGELYQKTLEKEKIIKELGYNLVVLWENDWMARNA